MHKGKVNISERNGEDWTLTVDIAHDFDFNLDFNLNIDIDLTAFSMGLR